MDTPRALAFVFLVIFTSTTSSASDTSDKPYLAAQRSLEVNRSLLAKTESEYIALSKEPSTPETSTRLENLRYKIQALKDDAARLHAELPKSLGADEFLKDLEPEDLGSAPRKHIDVAREKRLADRLDSIYAIHERALGLVTEKRYGEAAILYENVVLTSPDDDEAYLLLGHCRLLNGEIDMARDAFRSAIHIDPQNAREITSLYDNVLIENPQDAEAYGHLGFAHWILGNTEEADKAFRTALTIDPENREARVGLENLASQP